MGKTKRAPRAVWAALGLTAATLLAGCGGDGLFSEIESVSITPTTVAAPTAGTPSQFTVAVAIKNRSSGTVMATLSMRRTSDGPWERIAVATCAHNQPCETEPVVMACYVNLPAGDSDRRHVDCVGNGELVQRNPGTVKLRLELRDYDFFTGLSSVLDDSAEREITLQ